MKVDDPPAPLFTETQVSQLIIQAGRTASQKKTPESKTAGLLKRVNPNLNAVEKDEVRSELKSEISTELKDDGFRPGLIESVSMVFANLLVDRIELVHAEPGKSIILYLKCESVGTLLRVKEMILSGLLLNLLSEVVKQIDPSLSRSHIQLVVQAEDYNLTLFHLSIVAGKSVGFLL